jgi:hypothetical protein
LTSSLTHIQTLVNDALEKVVVVVEDVVVEDVVVLLVMIVIPIQVLGKKELCRNFTFPG